MRRLAAPLFLLVCGIWAACGKGSEPAIVAPESTSTEYRGLKDAAPYPVGVALQASRLESVPRNGLVEKVFSSVTAEYEMKMEPLSTGPGQYAWDAVDRLVDYAEARNMQVHGHTLVWHQTTPAWLENFAGDDAAFEEAVRVYITDVVTRYRGRVISWDVVNEAFEDGTGALRNSAFRRRMGDDYLERVFQMARDADPSVLLFYNDYGSIWDEAKKTAILDMVDRFQTNDVPLDGVGLQMHVTYNSPPLENITDMMNELVRRGLKIHMSELDIRANPDGDLTTLTAARSEAQKARVKAIVGAFNDLPEANRFAITLWGLLDPDSWLIEFWGNPEWPLLFDSQFRPKPAYFGFLEALEERS